MGSNLESKMLAAAESFLWFIKMSQNLMRFEYNLNLSFQVSIILSAQIKATLKVS